MKRNKKSVIIPGLHARQPHLVARRSRGLTIIADHANCELLRVGGSAEFGIEIAYDLLRNDIARS